ncbi:perforin-like protein 1 [Plasmodium malariae]|uniref:Perforin-like protein 1 n=1 Tax=Plasmodium malariae TaxID=5858 RepID=A0A1D3JIC8_PLAMA|nr:perforin-like protein 1 [Plasmodium malariae]SBT86235.1 perforin-like protein 1 [Plasmodium malariae]
MKKHVSLLFIILYICHRGYVKSTRITRSKYHNYKGNEKIAFNENGKLRNIEKHASILCNAVSCNNTNDISFVNQKKNMGKEDEDLVDLYEDDEVSTSAGDSSSDEAYLSDSEEEENDDNQDENENGYLSNMNNQDLNNEDKGIKKHFKIEKNEEHINENKKKAEENFKRYKFNDENKSETERKLKRKDNIFHKYTDNDNNNDDEDDNKEDNKNEGNILNNKGIVKDKMNVFPGLYFVGIGYDLLFGNPLGEPDSLTDPGYRAQIYLLNWELSNRGVANDLNTLQPLNGWIRKENACSRAEMIKECSSISDYTSNLSSEASASGGYMTFASFSASVGYKKFLSEVSKRTSKTYYVKSNCIKYTIGLPPYVPWEKTEAYINAVEGLPLDFNGLEKDTECGSDVYEQNKTLDVCKNIFPWIQFFKTYGTHLIYEAQLGGKITKIINVSNSSVKKMKKDGVSVKAEIQAQFGFGSAGGSTNVSSDSSSSNNDESYEMSEQMVVIGGNPIKDVTKEENLFEWSKTVSENPMPISIKLFPLSFTFDSDELKRDYEKALLYYSRLYGFSPHDTMQKDEKDITKILITSSTVTKSGPPPISAECPHDMIVLFGYILKQNFWNNTGKLRGYDIELCESGLSSCTSKQGNSNKYDISYLYMECGSQVLPFSDQVVSVSDSTFNTVKCPNDYTIIFGFGFAASSGRNDSAQKTYVTPCRPGMKSCSLNMSKENDKSYMYLVCLDGTIWSGINTLTLVAKDDFHSAVNKSKKFNDGHLDLECPSEGKILTGFYGESHTSSPYVSAPFGKCSKSLKSCSVHGSGQGIGFQNYRTLFVILLCMDNEQLITNNEQ